MPKFILTLVVVLTLGIYVPSLFSDTQEPLGAFGDPFVSIQLATGPDNGECLSTNGTDNVWGSCGGSSSFSTSSNDIWAQTDLKLSEISDVQDGNAWGQLLYWTGALWATTSTSSLGLVGAADGNWSTTSADYWETVQTARTADDLSNNTTSDLAEGTNLYWTSARGTTSFNTLFSAGTVGWDTSSADDWSTTSSDYWETQQTARTADDLSNNTTSDLAEGTNLYWTTARGTTSFNTLFNASTTGWDTNSADDMATATPWTVGQVAYVSDNKTLTSVATGTLTEGITGLEFSATGNLVGSAAILNLTTGYSMFLTASGTNWNTFYDIPSNRITAGTGIDWSTNTLNVGGLTTSEFASANVSQWTNNANYIDLLDLSATYPISYNSSTGAFTWTGLATSTALADTQLIYGTAVGTIGSEAALTYDDATNLLTTGNASTTNLSVSTGVELFGGGQKTTANALCIQLTGASELCDGVDGGGGSGISGWATTTSQVSGQLNLYTTNTTDILNVGANATTSSEFWMDPNTSTFQINGSNGSSTYIFGSAGNEWVLGTSDANKSMRIASSTGLLDGATSLLTLAKDGALTVTATSTASVFTGADANSTSTFPRLSVTTAFNFLGDYITVVLTWFDAKIEALTAVVLQGTWDWGGATSLEIVNGANPTVDTAGEIALDTTDDQFLIADGGDTVRVFGTDEFRVVSVTVASTSVAFASGQLLPAFNHKDALEFTQFKCFVSGGTSKVLNLTDGTNDTETITCNTTDTSDTDVGTNDTFTAGELGSLEFGATTGTVDYVHFEAYARITRE